MHHKCHKIHVLNLNAHINYSYLVSYSNTCTCIIFSFSNSGEVYDITHYLTFHPGGKSKLMRAAGTDCTLLFNQVANHAV